MGNIVNLKLGVYGEGGVGKTSLVNIFIGKEVPNNYSPTFNSKVSRKEYTLEKTGVTFKINIWDVGGNRAINPNINNAFFSDVDIALIVFDLTKPELTLKSYEKNFLNRINRYSEEPLTLIAGNKLDKLSLNKDFKDAVQNYLGEKKKFLITSATSELNVDNCFELLIYTFLKKSEILLPDLVPENSSVEFIDLIRKTEEELRGQLVNLSSIDLKLRDLKPKIKVEEIPSQEEDNEKKYHEFIQQELEKISLQKTKISDIFIESLSETEKEVNQLKKYNIKSTIELVDKLRKSLEISKKNTELQLETLNKLNREENELLIISSKFRKDESEIIPKSELKPLEIKPKPKPELQTLAVKPKPKLKSELKPLEIKPKPKPKLQALAVKPKPKLKSELKPLEIKPKPKPELEALKVKPKPKLKSELKPLEIKPKPKPKLQALEVKPKPKLKPELKPLEIKPKPKPEPSKPKIKKVKITSKPVKRDPKIELYNKFERNNPGKRAVYRGKETNGFLEWKKKQKT